MDKRLKSKEWRVNHLYQIKNKDAKKIQFRRNEAQEDFNKNKHTRNIILKSRQLGFTTEESIDTTDDVLWNRNFDALFISYDKASAEDIFDNKFSYAWDNYPTEFKNLYTIDTKNVRKFKFDFGDGTKSSITVSLSGRSGTYRRVHVSEFGRICRKYPAKAKEILEGTIPAVPLDGRIDIESTAEGDFGLFHDMFWDAWERGEPKHQNEWKAHFYNWTWDKTELRKIKKPVDFNVEPISTQDRDRFIEYKRVHNLSDVEITYYYFKWLDLGKKWKSLQQEYPTTPEEAFVSSGNKFFETDFVDLQKEFELEGERVGDWVYYDKYKPGHKYALGADVAEGVGGDSSTCVVWDFTPIKPRVVATFASNSVDPGSEFAGIVKAGCTLYGSCKAAVENNLFGHTTNVKLKEIYSNLYTEIRKGDKFEKKTDKLGWNTNIATKPRMMDDIKTAVEDAVVEIPSATLVREMRTYQKEDLRVLKKADDQTQHWDLLIAAAIGFQMRDQVNSKVYNFNKTNKNRILK